MIIMEASGIPLLLFLLSCLLIQESTSSPIVELYLVQRHPRADGKGNVTEVTVLIPRQDDDDDDQDRRKNIVSIGNIIAGAFTLNPSQILEGSLSWAPAGIRKGVIETVQNLGANWLLRGSTTIKPLPVHNPAAFAMVNGTIVNVTALAVPPPPSPPPPPEPPTTLKGVQEKATAPPPPPTDEDEEPDVEIEEEESED